jgi:hypothetical protein
VPAAEAGSAAPAAALPAVPDTLVADCTGAPVDGTSAAVAVEPETELAVFEEAVPDWLAPEPAELASVAAAPECPVRACDAALTVEPTTELAVETGEPAGGGGSVAACACRENTSMMKKIPAARIASCVAR